MSKKNLCMRSCIVVCMFLFSRLLNAASISGTISYSGPKISTALYVGVWTDPKSQPVQIITISSPIPISFPVEYQILGLTDGLTYYIQGFLDTTPPYVPPQEPSLGDPVGSYDITAPIGELDPILVYGNVVNINFQLKHYEPILFLDGNAVDLDASPVQYMAWNPQITDIDYTTGFGGLKLEVANGTIADRGIIDISSVTDYIEGTNNNIDVIIGHVYNFKTTNNIPVKIRIFDIASDNSWIQFQYVYNYISIDNSPWVEITFPTSGQNISGLITISGTAGDDIGVNRVEFFIDISSGSPIYTVSAPPYEWAWDTTKFNDGLHNIILKVFDTKNQMSQTEKQVNVNNHLNNNIYGKIYNYTRYDYNTYTTVWGPNPSNFPVKILVLDSYTKNLIKSLTIDPPVNFISTTDANGYYSEYIYYTSTGLGYGPYDLYAYIDENNNDKIDVTEPKGSYTWIYPTYSYSYSYDVWLSKPETPDGYIYATIYYSGTNTDGDLIVELGTGTFGTSDWFIKERNKYTSGTYSLPAYANFYGLDYTSYTLVAGIDINNNNILDKGAEPVIETSNIILSGVNNYQYKEVHLEALNQLTGGNKITGSILSSLSYMYDKLIVAIGLGEIGPNWRPVKKQVFINGISFPVTYTLDNIPDDTDPNLNYNLYAGIDTDWNGNLDSFEPVFKTTQTFGVIAGSITLTGVNIIIPGKNISGYITNSDQFTAPLLIALGTGNPDNWTDDKWMSAKKQRIDYHNYSNFYYDFRYIEEGTDYYVYAGIDDNYNGKIDMWEPKGKTGPLSLTGDWTQADNITLTLGQQFTGNNTIQGNVYFSGNRYDQIFITVGQGNGITIADSTKRGTKIFGPGLFSINNLVDGTSYYASAFMDTNYNNIFDQGEPNTGMVFVGDLIGGTTKSIDLNLSVPEAKVSTITVSISGKAVNGNTGNWDDIIGGCKVDLFDTGAWNDWNPDNDKLIQTTYANYTQVGSGASGYNFRFDNINVKVSYPISGQYYYYRIKVSSNGWNSQDYFAYFESVSANTNVNIGQIWLYPRIKVSVSPPTISPKIISPDNDMIDDKADISFKYTAYTSNPSWEIGGNVKVIVDINKDGRFVPMNWGLFIWANGKEFIKWNYETNQPDPNLFIEFDQFGNIKESEYAKLKGPITQDEKDKWLANFDATFEQWIDGYSLVYDNGNLSKTVNMTWEGRDNSWRPVKNGDYNIKVFVYDTKMDLIYESDITTVTIQTNSIIGKLLVKGTTTPVEGARITLNGFNVWTQAFSDSYGNFELSGLKQGESYHIEIKSDKYIMKTLDNVMLDSSKKDLGTIELENGIRIYGTVTLPNPPKAGEITDPYSGNPIYEIWGGVEVWRIDGPGWSRADFHTMLPYSTTSQLVMDYSLFVEPGKYQIKAQMPGYISTTEDIIIENTDIQKNILLQKASSLKGIISIPEDTNIMTGAGNYGGINININAESLDYKNHAWANAYIPFGSTWTYFIMNNLTPATSYYIQFESYGNFARKKKLVYIETGDNDMPEIIKMDKGASLTGTIEVYPGVIEILQQKGWYWTDSEGYMHIGGSIRSLEDYTSYGGEVKISTYPRNGVYPIISTYTIVGLSSGTYQIELDVQGIDITPNIEGRKVTVELTGTIAPTIQLKKPTGVFAGKIIDKTGKNVIYNSVVVVLAYPEGGGGFYTTIPDTNGNFKFNDLPTGDAVIWATEYDIQKTMTGLGGVFGVPSGKSGLSMFWQPIQSGVTTYKDIELKPGSTIFVTVKGSSSIINQIYNKESEMISVSTSQLLSAEFPPHFIRAQSLVLRKFVEERPEGDPNDTGRENSKEISFSGLLLNKIDDNTLTFVVNGLEPGVYYVYPMAGIDMTVRTETPNPYGGYTTSYSKFKYEIASNPYEMSVVLNENETKEVEFVLGTGAKLTGTIIRPNSGIEETIQIRLKTSLGKDIAASDIVFSSTTKTLRTGNFIFENLSGGKYLLTVMSQNYKIYSKIIEITAGVDVQLGQIQLSKGANIIGKLADEDGKPVTEGITVSCFASPFVDGSYRDTEMPGVSITTYPQSLAGQFTFSNLPAGNYILKVQMKSDAKVNYMNLEKAGITVPESSIDVDIGTIKLKKGTVISGKVLGQANEPVAGVKIKAYPVDTQLRLTENIVCTNTNDKGEYVLNGINPDIKYWEIIANVREENIAKQKEEMKYGPAFKTNIQKGSSNIDFILPLANARITGKVIVPQGSQLVLPFPVEGIDVEDFPAALILLQSPKDQSSGDPMAGIKTLTKPDATFEIKGLVPGTTYKLKIFAKGFSTYEKSSVEIKSGTTTVIPDCELVSGLSVSGNIGTKTGKISLDDVSIVVAATKNLKEFVFGTLSYNSVSKEINSYNITGIKPNTTYYIVLVQPERNKIFVDPKPFIMDGSTSVIKKDVLYFDYPPKFQAKAVKITMLNLLLKYLFPKYADKFSDINDTENRDIYFIYVYTDKPLQETRVSNVISTTTNSQGIIIPLNEDSLSENKMSMGIVYVPKFNDITIGYFELAFHGYGVTGTKGEEKYKFYIGEEARSEKLINPVVGGEVMLGEGDISGLELPAGAINDEIAVTSGTKVTVTKVSGVDVGKSAMSLETMNKKIASIPPHIRGAAFSAQAPGIAVSEIYDVQVRLVSGPLATLASGQTATVKIKVSSNIVSGLSESDVLKAFHYDDNSQSWIEETNSSLDLSALMMNIYTTHFSKFAVFAVTQSTTPTEVSSTTVNIPTTVSTTVVLGSGSSAVEVFVDTGTFASSVNLTVERKTGQTLTQKGLKTTGIEVNIDAGGIQPVSGKSLTLTIHYADTDIIGLDETKLKIVYFNTSTNKWETITSVVNTNANKVTGTITHLSKFQLVEVQTTPETYTGPFKSYFYPNPYKPKDGKAYIAFYIPDVDNHSNVDVKIKIYNIAGELIKTIDVGSKESGYKYQDNTYGSNYAPAEWSGTNENDEPVASGVYIYHIKAGNNSEIKKFAIIR